MQSAEPEKLSPEKLDVKVNGVCEWVYVCIITLTSD